MDDIQSSHILLFSLLLSQYIIDLEGMGMYDFVGECKDFVKQASDFTAQHYPERAGVVLVVNVPMWFKMVWNVSLVLPYPTQALVSTDLTSALSLCFPKVVSKWVDEVTLKKIFILRGKEEILETLSQKIVSA